VSCVRLGTKELKERESTRRIEGERTRKEPREKEHKKRLKGRERTKRSEGERERKRA
jgi:hypothetical protein